MMNLVAFYKKQLVEATFGLEYAVVVAHVDDMRIESRHVNVRTRVRGGLKQCVHRTRAHFDMILQHRFRVIAFRAATRRGFARSVDKACAAFIMDVHDMIVYPCVFPLLPYSRFELMFRPIVVLMSTRVNEGRHAAVRAVVRAVHLFPAI